MITVAEAHRLISSCAHDFGTETIPLEQAIGRILREPIIADRDFPPYNRVTMDGIAIRFGDFAAGTTTFKISGVAPAGAPRKSLDAVNECLEVMTGAIMPEGLDTVIPYEQVDIQYGRATLQINDTTKGKNIHRQGEDRKAGEEIIAPGHLIASPEIGVCATVGKANIQVSRLPKTLVLSSGDELVPIDTDPLEHQIRRSNVHRLQAALLQHHIVADTAHISDEYEVILEKLEGYLKRYELILLSGGVSKGKFDYIPKALEALEVKKHFHRVAQRPGKPFWFGSKEKTTVFAFPGNPISSFMCMQVYFGTWLNQCLQTATSEKELAVLAEDVHFKPDLTYFLEVRLSSSDEGMLLARPAKGNGSGDLANLVEADAFIELPQGRDLYNKGDVFSVIRYR